MISIIDYGMGNLRSVQKAFERVGAAAQIVTSPAEIAASDRLVLPGVGAFRDAIHELRRLDLVEPIRDHVAADKLFLGICLGLQMLFDVSYEDGEYEGLGIIPGKVVRFESRPGVKIPHMGWNSLIPRGEQPMLRGLPDDATVYFVHSYHVVPDDPSVIATETDYDGRFVSSISRRSLFAAQFHPEKSQNVGLQLLANFAGLGETSAPANAAAATIG